MSLRSNPVTASLKLTATVMGDVLVGLGAADVMVTVGRRGAEGAAENRGSLLFVARGVLGDRVTDRDTEDAVADGVHVEGVEGVRTLEIVDGAVFGDDVGNRESADGLAEGGGDGDGRDGDGLGNVGGECDGGGGFRRSCA